MYVEHLAGSQQLFPQYIMLLTTDPQNWLICSTDEKSEAYRNIQFIHDCKLVSGRVITETHVWGWGISSVAENKPHNCESLGSIFRTNEKTKTNKQKEAHFCLPLKFMLFTLHFEVGGNNMDLLRAKWAPHLVVK